MSQHASDKGFSVFDTHDRIGVVYLDKDLSVLRSRGFLSDTMLPGSNPCLSETPLNGMDASIRALPNKNTEGLLFVSYVSLDDSEETTKVSVRIHWSESDNIFIGWFFRCRRKVAACEHALANVKQQADPQQKYLKIYLEQIEYLLAKLREKNEQLESIQKELAQFTQIAAHDLRSPIRVIKHTAEWLKADLGNDLTPKVTDHVDRLERQSIRASKLVTDLLSFCQIGNKEFPLENVDCLELLNDISDSLLPPSGPKIVVKGSKVVLETLRTPLDLVIRNLVDNAVKYHDLNDGNVVIRCSKKAHECVFEIQDDGPGISKEHQKRVFEPFEKLESYDAVPGSGLGLAQVERTVLTYGGSIKLQSPVAGDRGSRFTVHWPVTLPKN